MFDQHLLLILLYFNAFVHGTQASSLDSSPEAMVRIEGFFEDSDPAFLGQGGEGKGTKEKT